MIVDDRLATVLATPLSGAPGTATQVRQLIDLLDRMDEPEWHALHDAALERTAALLEGLPEPLQVRIAAEAAVRSPRLAEALASRPPRVAAAALATARLDDAQWLALIPRLSPLARGLLRHRRDMARDRSSAPARLLARLGVSDAALPLPPGFEPEASAAFAPRALHVVAAMPGDEAETIPVTASASPPRVAEEVLGIGAIVRRIEAFRRNRTTATARNGATEAAAGPAGDQPSADAFASPALSSVDIAIDPAGTIIAAEGAAGAMLVGHRPFTADRRAPASCDPATLLAARQRCPVTGGRIRLEGAPAIAGDWRIDAVPCFEAGSRTFGGWRARLRRPVRVVAASAANSPANDDGRSDRVPGPTGTAPAIAPRPRAERETDDRLRQLLHELKTPINAIQGFAELIQQQVLGPVAHHYRGYAASIASDAATMLAQFEAIDQLVRLESGRQSIDPGETEARAALTLLVDRLAPLFDQRHASIAFQPGDEPLQLGIAPDAFEAMGWRLLSTIAAAALPGEQLTLRLGREGDVLRLIARLPEALVRTDAPGAPAPGEPGPLLGRDFALRLLGAEVRAAGGTVRQSERFLTLVLPLLTHSLTNSSARGVSTGSLGD